MGVVYPSKRARFCDSFRAAASNISERLSDSQAASANGYFTKWSDFCPDVALDSLLVSYQDPVPILDTFAGQYRIGDLSPRVLQVKPCTVEDNTWSIEQATSTMRSPEPLLPRQV